MRGRNLLSLVGLVVLACGSVVYGHNWTKFHFDNANTGVTPDRGPDSNNIKWIYHNADTGSFDTPPAVVDSKVYCGTSKGWMFCFNADNGEVIWKKKYNCSFGKSGPCIVGDKIYIGTQGGVIYCFNTSDGSSVWSYNTGDDWVPSPVVYNNKVYVSGGNKYLYCLNDSDGALVWKFYTDSGDYIASAVAIYNDRLYVSSTNTEVWCISLVDTSGNGWIDHGDTNELYWSYRANGANSSPVVVNHNSHNYLFVARNNGDAGVVCIDIDTHAQHSFYAADSRVYSTPVFFNGFIYFGSNGGIFYAYIFNGSSSDWTYDTEEYIQSSPALSANNNRIYFTGGDDRLYCFDAGNGDMIWSDNSQDYDVESPSVVSDVLYVTDGGTTVIAYGQSSGNATVNAYCYSEDKFVSVPIDLNGLPTDFNTPYTFISVGPDTTFSVPLIDANGHSFRIWSNGEDANIVTLGGYSALTAYYGRTDCEIVNLNNVNPVNLKDFAIFAQYWLSTVPGQPGDFDEDGSVGMLDLEELASCWLEDCAL